MADARKLVERWFDERVEEYSGAVTSSYNAFGDFIEWWREQEDRGDGIEARQFGTAMKRMGFGAERDDDDDWIIRGIKLRND